MSLWYPEKDGLRGISGQHFNKYLPEMASEDISWGAWIDKHPQTKLLN